MMFSLLFVFAELFIWRWLDFCIRLSTWNTANNIREFDALLKRESSFIGLN